MFRAAAALVISLVATAPVFAADTAAVADPQLAVTTGGDQYPSFAPGGTRQVVVTAGPPSGFDTGSEGAPNFASGGAGAVVVAGGMLPTFGSEGAPQSTASLPPHFAEGTPEYAQAQSVDRYLQAGVARSGRTTLARR